MNLGWGRLQVNRFKSRISVHFQVEDSVRNCRNHLLSETSLSNMNLKRKLMIFKTKILNLRSSFRNMNEKILKCSSK